jgi:hypothetical protein
VNAALSLRSPRTARVVAVTLLWIARTLASLVVASPLVFAIMSTGLVIAPERDAPLFRPGALLLLELVRTGAPQLGAALRVSLVLFALCAILELVPLGAALDLLRTQCADALGARFERGFRLFPRFFALSGLTLLAQAALILAASLLGTALSAALHGRDERLLTVLPIALFGVGLLCCAWLGAVLDVARSLVTRHDLGARMALFEALTILRDDPLAVLVGSYPSVAGSTFAWLTGAWILAKLELANPATRSIALAFVVHQTAVLLSVALRVRWLEGALALAERAPSARD